MLRHLPPGGGPLPRMILVLGAAIGVCVYLWSQSARVAEEHGAVAYNVSSNIQHAGQLQQEALLTSLALLDFEAGRIGHAELMLRFDLLWNELDVVGAKRMAEDPALDAALARFQMFLSEAELRFAGLSPVDSDAIAGLRADLEAERLAVKSVWMRNVVSERFDPLVRIMLAPEADQGALFRSFLFMVALLVIYLLLEMHSASRGRRREREMREAAASADRAKTEFLALVSHEIRTPINGVLGMAALLERTELGERQRLFVDTIRSSGRILMQLIDDILNYARIETGDLSLQEGPEDLVAIVYEPALLAAPEARAKGLDFAVVFDPALPARILTDGARFSQLLSNLLNNAVKFTDRGEVVLEIAAGRGGSGAPMLDISVRDTGIGVAETDRPHIFEKFYQAGDPSTRTRQGVGLGLSICARIVELMGGRIAVKSTPGEGSSFHVRLPMATPAGKAAPAIGTADYAGRRIMVIDPNAQAGAGLARIIEAWGAEAITVADGATAGAAMRTADAAGRPFDLAVIRQTRAPAARGEATGEMVAPGPGVPVIRLGALAAENAEGAASRGPIAPFCLPDPATPGVLRSAIDEALTLGAGAGAAFPARAATPGS